jgi:hypothetical protein
MSQDCLNALCSKVDEQEKTVDALTEKVSLLEALNIEKDDRLEQMQKDISKLTQDIAFLKSLNIVKDRVTDELSNEIVRLQQYTRRYSVNIKGLPVTQNETNASLTDEIRKVIDETESAVTIADVDKLHRNGPRRDGKQDIIIRFKSHSAKEAFYKKRKTVKRPNLKIQPSLCEKRRQLLNEANDLIASYQNDQVANRPDFVLADIHGNLLVKMSLETNGRSFHKFETLQQLHDKILVCQPAHPEGEEERDLYPLPRFAGFPQQQQRQQQQQQLPDGIHQRIASALPPNGIYKSPRGPSSPNGNTSPPSNNGSRSSSDSSTLTGDQESIAGDN